MRRILLVIGLITVLVGAGWVVRAWSTFRVNARTSKLNDDIENLFAALQQYKENLGGYPSGASNSEIAKALRGKNPKNVIILVGKKNELNEKGEFVDPWGTPLRIYFSDNGVLIRSAGPNKRFDDSTTVEADDYLRSN
jgi:hypothetical protein